MKHLINARNAIASVGMMVFFGGIGFAQCSIAVVDIQAAVIGSNEGKAQSRKFDARTTEWVARLDRIKSEISAAQRNLNGQSGIPNQAYVDELNKIIRDKTSELTRTTSDAQKDVDTYRDSLLGPLKKSAAEIAEMVAAEKGISSVVDSSTTPSTRVPAGVSKDCDITTEVKTRMNAKSGVDTLAK